MDIMLAVSLVPINVYKVKHLITCQFMHTSNRCFLSKYMNNNLFILVFVAKCL
jgi:hypothetical protein